MVNDSQLLVCCANCTKVFVQMKAFSINSYAYRNQLKFWEVYLKFLFASATAVRMK